MNKTKTEVWKMIDDPSISKLCEISNFGNLRYNINGEYSIIDPYHSTNGYDYHFVLFEDNISTHLVRVDKLVAITFLPISDELINHELTIDHIDGNLRNNDVNNLRWVEDIEVWYLIDFPPIVKNKYYISSWGRVKHDNEDPLFGTNNRGYKHAFFRIENGSRKDYPLHRIVANAFIGLQDGLVVNHIDGFTDNNHVDNLEVVTSAMNNEHAHLTGLNISSTNPFLLRLIRYSLMRNDWYPTKALNELHENGYKFITLNMIHNVKKSLIDHGEEVKCLHSTKLNSELRTLIENLLIKYNGDRKIVTEDLHNLGYININEYNVGTVKAVMKSFNFPNMRLNRKINEQERVLLIAILKDCGMSPSKAIKVVHNTGMNHVTLYDLKYLKRKMLAKNNHDEA